MGERVRYERRGDVAWIHMDDGKANAINGPMLDELAAGLDRAEADGAGAVALAGRLGFFSGGLDIKTLPGLPPDELRRVLTDFGALAGRLAGFPRPVLAVSAGHALAGGAVLMLCADWRVGCAGPFKYGLHEVSIGIALPSFVCELARHALDPRFLFPVVAHGQVLDPAGARAAGLLDALHEPPALIEAAQETASRLAALPDPAYRKTKQRLRRPVLQAIEDGTTEAELTEHFAP